MTTKKLRIISLFLCISFLLNIVGLFTIWKQKSNNNYALYFVLNRSLEEFHSNISEIDKSLKQMEESKSNNDENLLKTLSKSYYNLKTSRDFMTKMYHLNSSFDFDIDDFHSYILTLITYSNRGRKLSSNDIQALRDIVILEKELIPDDKTLQMFVEDPYYNKLIIGFNYYNKSIKLYPSRLLKNTFKKIDEISSKANNELR